MPAQKTGSTSIAFLLEKFYQARIFKEWKHPLKSTDDGYLRHLNFLPKQFESFYVFASIRNPFEREISLYEEIKNWKLQTKEKIPYFGVYLKKGWLKYKNAQYEQLGINQPIPYGCVLTKFDHFVRLENIEEDFNKLPFISKKITIPKKRISNNRHFYSQNCLNIVLKERKIDFEILGYSEKCPIKLLMKEYL